MQAQANKCFLKIIVAQLLNEKCGSRVVAVDDHGLQELAIGIDGTEGRQILRMPEPPFLSLR